MEQEWMRPFWQDRHSDEGGFSTVGVAIALLVALSLVFAGAQVYRIQSAAAEVQEVADAAALAGDNVVAEYYLVARVCDAIVLSLGITGIVALGMGVAALCTPLSSVVGHTLLKAGRAVLKARDAFAAKAARGLEKLQKAVPFLVAAAAVRVAQANRGALGTGYFGFAVALPLEGQGVSAGDGGSADALLDAVDVAADGLERAGEEAERAAKEAKRAKEIAYRADCGANPGYCMYERASALAGMSGEENPFFGSVDTWGFAVALARAKAYYPHRLAQESPAGESVDEQANSALRKRFYAYAVQRVSEGYVHDSEDSFEADFPLLPKNVEELRATPLYSEAVYPVTANESGKREMHAWEGCPHAAGSMDKGSLAQREAEKESFEKCPLCEFDAASLGNVAAASSNIGNGFEYHYRIVAEQAQTYATLRKSLDPATRKVRQMAGTLFDDALSSLRAMASQRITVTPPGRLGVVAIVTSTGSQAVSAGVPLVFGGHSGNLGTRVAIAGAALASDTPAQGRTVLSSLLDGLRERTGSPVAGAFDGLMDLWSSVLFAYADGQQRIGEGIDKLDSRLSLGSESRLGVWSSKQFAQTMESLGLQPAALDAPKPVLVNTGHVLKEDGGSFSARLLSVKSAASGLSGGNLLEGLVDIAEGRVLEGIEGLDDELTVAEIEIAGEGSPKVPIVIAIPDTARSGAADLVSRAAEALRSVAGSITGVRQWQ